MATTLLTPDRRRLLWAVWGAATTVVVLLAVGVPLLVPDPATTVPAALPAALAGSAGLGAIVGVLVLDRGLAARTPADAETAARELTTRLVLQVALLEAPTLLSVALAAVVGPPVVVLAGAVPALVGLVLVRPGDARLARLRRAWRGPASDAPTG